MTRRMTAAFGRGTIVEHGWLWPTMIWLCATVAACVARPLLASIESPLLAATWWSWQGIGDVPYLPTLAAQPALLPWLIQAGWHVLGTSEIWPRLAAGLFGLGTLWLMAPLGRLMWPDRPDVSRLASIILAGSGGFLAYAAMALQMPLLLFAIVAMMIGLLKARARGSIVDWSLVGAAIGMAYFAVGAIALQFMVPIAVLLPITDRAGFASSAMRRWLVGCTGAILLGGAAALAGHLQAGDSLLNAMRLLFVPATEASGGDTRPWYWYLALLPLVLYPWIWWPTLWRAVGRGLDDLSRPELRLCGLVAAVALTAACINGRYSYLLMPMLPPLSLMAAWFLAAHAGKPKDFHAAIPGLMALFLCLFFFLLNIVPVAHLDAVWREIAGFGLPIWLGGISLAAGIILLFGSYLLTLLTPRGLRARVVQLALLPLLLVITTSVEFIVNLRPYFDLTPMAQRIESVQRSGQPVAVLGAYTGGFDFIGRLQAPLIVLASSDDALEWARGHRDGVVISFFTGSILYLPAQPLYLGNAEARRAALWPASAVTSTGGLVLKPEF
ncbi:MAG: ArnT family glycosyltransferase [Dongiaceae bacterium]